MRKATEALEQEHKIIQKAVAVMAQIVTQLEFRHAVNPDVLRDLLQFMREFSDQCHHGKEESYFFPFLESKGVPSTGCPLAALKGEHLKSRQLLHDLNSAAAAYIEDAERGRSTLIQVLQSLVALYPAHIWKEDYLLFPMADKILAESDQELLLREFEKAEEVLGTGAHERFDELANDLSERIDHCPQCDQLARPDGRIRKPVPTSGTVLRFDLAKEIDRLLSEQPWQAEHTANTIAKYADLRVVLVALKAGGRLHEHRTAGRLSIQTLTGEIKVHVEGGIVEMPAGSLLTLEHDVPHDVEANTDSVFLLTIAWPK